MKSSKSIGKKMLAERCPVAERTDSARLDALEVDVTSLKGQVATLDTRTLGMDKKLDQLLIREEIKKPPHEPSYYIGLIAGTLLIAGSILTAANWYIRSAVGDTVGMAQIKTDHRADILDIRVKALEQAIAWTPSLVANARLKEFSQ
jgi:hypothetical protein